jgi:hypothetical protein
LQRKEPPDIIIKKGDARMDEDNSIQKNKRIITIAVLIFVFSAVGYILLNSTLNDTIYFHYIYNQRTGEPMSLIGSILLYLLFGFVLGLIPFSITFLFSLCLYFFLHRKETNFYYNDHPKHEEEYFYGGYVALLSTYAAVYVLLILHISNIATIHIF